MEWLSSIAEINRDIFLYINGGWGDAYDSLFWMLSAKLVWAPLYALIIYLIYRKVGLQSMIIAVVMMVLMVVITDHIGNFFKDNYSQFRPTHDPLLGGDVHTVNGYRGGKYGTVSSHTSLSFSIAIFTMLLLRSRWVSVPLIIWAALVSFSRIYLGVHYPKDIIYGFLLGCGAGYLFYKIWIVGCRKWSEYRVKSTKN